MFLFSTEIPSHTISTDTLIGESSLCSTIIFLDIDILCFILFDIVFVQTWNCSNEFNLEDIRRLSSKLSATTSLNLSALISD